MKLHEAGPHFASFDVVVTVDTVAVVVVAADTRPAHAVASDTRLAHAVAADTLAAHAVAADTLAAHAGAADTVARHSGAADTVAAQAGALEALEEWSAEVNEAMSSQILPPYYHMEQELRCTKRRIDAMVVQLRSSHPLVEWSQQLYGNETLSREIHSSSSNHVRPTQVRLEGLPVCIDEVGA